MILLPKSEKRSLARPAITRVELPQWRRWARLAAWLTLILLGLLAANLVSLRWRPNLLYQLDVGRWGDHALLDGFFDGEVAPSGVTYRWAGAQSSFTVRDFAAVSQAVLRLDIGGLPQAVPAPRPLQVRMDDQVLIAPVATEGRHYHLLVPSTALLDGDMDVRLASETSRTASDSRMLGVRLDDVALGWSSSAWALPTWCAIGVQWAIVALWLALAWRLELPRWAIVAVAAGLILLLAGMAGYRLLMAGAWQARLLAAGALLLALSWNAYDWLERWFSGLVSRPELRWLCGLALLAAALRLFAVFYPAFDSHDLYIHRRRLLELQLGSIQLFDRPWEFNRSRTIVPPAFYMLVSPWTLITATPGVAIEGMYALVDGTSALLLGLLVRLIGGSPRASLVAAIALVSLPIQLTTLWWGFAPQVLGQWLLLALAVVLARQSTLAPQPSRNFWIVVGMLLLLAFLMHPGVAILGGVWLAAYVAFTWKFERHARGAWLPWGLLLVGAALIATVLLYIDVVWLQVSGIARGATAPSRYERPLRLLLLWRGTISSLRPLGIPLALLCMIVWLRTARGTHRWLVAAWLASTGLFFVVDLFSGLQVRYAYFVIPMICAGLGLILDQLIARGAWGRLVGWGLVGMVVFSGTSLWLNGVFAGIKPTLTALQH